MTLIRLYLMQLISTSSFFFCEVLSLCIVIVGLLFLLDKKNLLRSPGNLLFCASLIGVNCWAMCATRFDSSISLIISFVVLYCGMCLTISFEILCWLSSLFCSCKFAHLMYCWGILWLDVLLCRKGGLVHSCLGVRIMDLGSSFSLSHIY